MNIKSPGEKQRRPREDQVLEILRHRKSLAALIIFEALANSRPCAWEAPGPRELKLGERLAPGHKALGLTRDARRHGLKVLEVLGVAVLRPLPGGGLAVLLQVDLMGGAQRQLRPQAEAAFLQALGPQLAARLDHRELAARLSSWRRGEVLAQALALARQAAHSNKNNSILRPLAWIDRALEQGRGQAALAQEQGRAAEARRAKAAEACRAAAAAGARRAQAVLETNMKGKKIADIPLVNNDFNMLREKRRADRAALTEELAKAGGAR